MQKKTVRVKHLTIGEGAPKIIVPITATTPAQANEMAARIAATAEVDMAEFRIDFQEKALDKAAMAELTRTLAATLGGKPLLATFRTHAEGGQKAISTNDYAALYEAIIESGAVDLIDIEMMLDESVVSALVEMAHRQHVAVVMSNHDFHATPPVDVIVARLRKQEQLGADILKIATMPQNAGDTLRLMSATWEVSSTTERIVLTMSMAGTGTISRLSGELTGSALTFGKLGAGSAPGQIDVKDLHGMLQIIHAATAV